MKIQQFLEHHGIATNPFADEDAQTDLVFKGYCIRSTLPSDLGQDLRRPGRAGHGGRVWREGLGQDGHAAADRPAPDRLQRRASRAAGVRRPVRRLQSVPGPLSRAASRAGSRGPDRVLGQWKLWDHMDAILSLAVTQLVDRLLEVKQARHPAARDEPLPSSALDAAPGARPAAAGRLLRPIDGREPSGAVAAAAAQAAVSALGGRSGTWAVGVGRDAWPCWPLIAALGKWAWLAHGLALPGRSPPAGRRWLWQLREAGTGRRGGSPATRECSTTAPACCGRC